jgi:hypothetical protein
VGHAPEVALNRLLFAKMSYDPIADLTPIALADPGVHRETGITAEP